MNPLNWIYITIYNVIRFVLGRVVVPAVEVYHAWLFFWLLIVVDIWIIFQRIGLLNTDSLFIRYFWIGSVLAGYLYVIVASYRYYNKNFDSLLNEYYRFSVKKRRLGSFLSILFLSILFGGTIYNTFTA